MKVEFLAAIAVIAPDAEASRISSDAGRAHRGGVRLILDGVV